LAASNARLGASPANAEAAARALAAALHAAAPAVGVLVRARVRANRIIFALSAHIGCILSDALDRWRR
ncbi:hypothetical protein T492DRAFT_886538, partial [Pavlovales sp. CCMP2436]